MLCKNKFDKRFCLIVVRILFFVIFIFENERTLVQFDTIKTKNILSVISMLGNVALKF